MKLETLQEMWHEDAKFNRLELDSDAMNVPQLHSKWYKLYVNERLAFKRQEADLKILTNHRYQFYEGTMDDETLEELKWGEEYRKFSRKILKSDISRHIESDKIVIEATLKIAYQKEKVLFLESVLDNIKYRGNLIKTALDFMKFTNAI
jgi:hypothetical protein